MYDFWGTVSSIKQLHTPSDKNRLMLILACDISYMQISKFIILLLREDFPRFLLCQCKLNAVNQVYAKLDQVHLCANMPLY